MLGALGAALCVASTAAAHPGHGLAGGSASWLHYLSDPVHVGPPALVALAVGLGWQRWRRDLVRARTRTR
jgi:hypothetical protein